MVVLVVARTGLHRVIAGCQAMHGAQSLAAIHRCPATPLPPRAPSPHLHPYLLSPLGDCFAALMSNERATVATCHCIQGVCGFGFGLVVPVLNYLGEYGRSGRV